MNQGFFNFPNQYLKDNSNLYVKEFDVSGTFAIPAFAKRLYILLIGGGGSGGSGARQASNTNSCGGGGGGGGSMFIEDIPLYMLNAPPGTILNVVIGAGGSAPSGASVDGTTGVAGNPGSSSSLTVNGKRGFIAVAAGGLGGGLGGTATTSTGAASRTSWWFGNISGSGHGGGNGAVVSFAQGPGATPLPASSNGVWNWQSNGGCGAGGVDTTNTASSGGALTAGGLVTSQYATIYSSGNNIIQPGVPNSPTVTNDTADSLGYTIAGAYTPGLGGVGGGGGTTTAGGRGRNGYRGGGGGGGGGARNGFNGGNGGAGGNGYCVIIAY